VGIEKELRGAILSASPPPQSNLPRSPAAEKQGRTTIPTREVAAVGWGGVGAWHDSSGGSGSSSCLEPLAVSMAGSGGGR
jgi:hypothetical protein